MTKLKWDAVGERFYEIGVDRGVLYIDNNAGVPWNGLVSVSASSSGGKSTPYYQDGLKYLNIMSDESFEATIDAFTYPDEFAECDGTADMGNGFYVTQQSRKTFGLTYRTRVGNDVEGSDHAYKLHILYDARAEPTSHSYSSMGSDIDPSLFSWRISTIPRKIGQHFSINYKPSSHFVIDSRKTDPIALAYLEGVLHGAEGMEPRLPQIEEVAELVGWTVARSDTPVNLIGKGSNAIELHTNRATNPSMEAANSLSELSKNLFPNPSFEVDLYGVSASNMSISAQTSTSNATTGTKAAYGLISSNASIYTYIGEYADGVVGGQKFAFAVDARCASSTRSKYIVLRIIWRDATNAQVHGNYPRSPETGTYELSTAVGGSRWLLTATVPDGATKAQCLVYLYDDAEATVPPVSLSSIAIDSLCAIAGDNLEFVKAQAMDYFDGDSSLVGDYEHSWDGAPHASTSSRLVRNVDLVNSAIPLAAAAYQSKDSPLFGDSVSRSVIVADSADVGATQYYRDWTLNSTKGEVYAISLWFRSSVSRDVQVTFTARSNSTNVYNGYATTRTMVPGVWTYFTHSFYVPGAHDYVQIWPKIYDAPGNSVLDMDGVMVVRGTTTLPSYFDGDGGYEYKNQLPRTSWTGVNHASASEAVYYTELATSGRLGEAKLIEDHMWVFTENGYWEDFGLVPGIQYSYQVPDSDGGIVG